MQMTSMVGKLIRRSALILPINSRKFVEKAHLRGADAIVLDLEDSVPPSEKETARALVKDSIGLVGRGGSDVLVRINKDPSHTVPDLEASLHPGLASIVFPKAEMPEEILELDRQIEKLEKERGIAAGKIRLSLLIETPRGVLNAREIARASSRIESMALGSEDYRMELGIEATEDGREILFPFSWLILICKDAGLSPRGLLGSIAGFRDLTGFEKAAVRAKQLGAEGASCIHPDQVKILNRVFSPAKEQVDYARHVVEAFEEGLTRGTASVSLDGKMVDIPVYERARRLSELADRVFIFEKRKAEAFAALGLPESGEASV